MTNFSSSIPLLEKEFDFFEQYLAHQTHQLFSLFEDEDDEANTPPEMPSLPQENNIYVQVVQAFAPQEQHYVRILLLLALAPHFKPELLDVLIIKNDHTGAIYTELGGRFEQNPAKFRPTLQTAFFLLSQDVLAQKLKIAQWFDTSGIFYRKNILTLETQANEHSQQSLNNEVITPTEEFLTLLTGAPYLPKMSTSFPAEPLTTSLEWDDLVLKKETLQNIEEVIALVEVIGQNDGRLRVSNHVKPGFRALFYGPSGTGKSFTAALMGKRLGMPVLRVHSAMLTSKFVGETEKNLDRLFDTAEGRQWILLFDEGENFFGQRSAGGGNAQDHYVNQQLGYMLQRIEAYNGLVIVSTNRKVAMDQAFKRRFQAMIEFPEPAEAERRLLWDKMFAQVPLHADVQLHAFSDQYHELTGGLLTNVLVTAVAKMYHHNQSMVGHSHLEEAIAYEYKKMNWVFRPLTPTEKPQNSSGKSFIGGLDF